MNHILQKLFVIPSIYKGTFVDIDREINAAYQAYPFPWPNEKQYEQYTKEDALKTLDFSEDALKQFIKQFRLDFSFFKDKVVIDLGAGVGWDAFCLARNGAKSVYAVDNSGSSVKHGERFAQLLGIPNVKFFQCSLYELDRIGETSDVIISKGVLHHIFDLPRFVKALSHITKDRTRMLLAHSSYSSLMGSIHYFYNHLAWTLGGADLEKRIDVGVKLFRGWHWQLTDDLIRHRVNDLTGVFYMARSSGQIMRIFQRGGFSIRKIPGENFTSLYHRLKDHHRRMLEMERNKPLRKMRRFIAMGLAETFHVLSLCAPVIDRLLGRVYKFFFSKPAHLFIAQLAPSLKKNDNPVLVG